MGVTTSAVIGTVKATYNAGKKALEIADKLKNVELKEAIVDLREELIALREENIALKEQLKEKQKYNMRFSSEDSCYWNIKEGGTKEGPFCSNCYDAKELKVRLLSHGQGYYICPNCKTGINILECIDI